MKMTKEEAVVEFNRLTSLYRKEFAIYCTNLDLYNRSHHNEKNWLSFNNNVTRHLQYARKFAFKANKIRVKYFIPCVKRKLTFDARITEWFHFAIGQETNEL